MKQLENNPDQSIKIDMMMLSPKQHRNVPTDALGMSEKTILETELKNTAAKQKAIEEVIVECSICLLEFTQEEWVVKLKCNLTHIFHEECLS